MISYASVPLTVPSRSQSEEVAARIDCSTDFVEFAKRCWPLGGNVQTVWKGHLPEPPVRLGTLRWPTGASRFAVTHLLCSQTQLDAIREVVQVGSFHAAPLTLDDGRRSITTNMVMLPGRPIDQISGCNGLYLLTLCDDRFRWWWAGTDIQISPGMTSWASLLGTIGLALGVIFQVDSIPSAYLSPPSDLNSRYPALPMLLDTVCGCIGMRLVRNLDGTVWVMSVDRAKARLAANLALNPKTAGGLISLGPRT